METWIFDFLSAVSIESESLLCYNYLVYYFLNYFYSLKVLHFLFCDQKTPFVNKGFWLNSFFYIFALSCPWKFNLCLLMPVIALRILFATKIEIWGTCLFPLIVWFCHIYFINSNSQMLSGRLFDSLIHHSFQYLVLVTDISVLNKD